MRFKKSIILLMLTLLTVSLCACGIKPEEEENIPDPIKFSSVDQLVDYASKNDDEYISSFISIKGYFDLYMPRFLPKKYSIEEIVLEGYNMTLKFSNEDKTDSVTMSWDNSMDGRAKMRNFVKTGDDLKRVYKNIDVFYTEELNANQELTGRNLFWEQEDRIFKAHISEEAFQSTKKRRRYVDPAYMKKIEMNPETSK